MFYIKKLNYKNNETGCKTYYYCADETLKGISEKFKDLIKKGITDITIVEVVTNK